MVSSFFKIILFSSDSTNFICELDVDYVAFSTVISFLICLSIDYYPSEGCVEECCWQISLTHTNNEPGVPLNRTAPVASWYSRPVTRTMMHWCYISSYLSMPQSEDFCFVLLTFHRRFLRCRFSLFMHYCFLKWCLFRHCSLSLLLSVPREDYPWLICSASEWLVYLHGRPAI